MKQINRVWSVVVFAFAFTLINTAQGENIAFTQNLSLGMRGSEITALQQLLITSGFLKIQSPTSYFGALTKKALIEWQKSMNISPASGFFGPISRGKINPVVRPVPDTIMPVPSATGTTTTAVPNTAISIGNNGDPIRLVIPKLSIDAKFQYNGLKLDGTMEIPSNVTDVGWFIGSPRPGAAGNSVITGHVAQIRGGILTKPGVFSNLKDLRAGDAMTVSNNKGESFTFVVREIRSYDPNADATDVFTSLDSNAHLVLITCEGTWNAGLQSYSQRLVVFADYKP